MHATLGLIGRAHTVESDEIPSDDNSFSTPVLNSEEYRSIIPSLHDKTRSLKFFKHSFLKFQINKKFHCIQFGSIQTEISSIFQYFHRLQQIELINNIIYRTMELLDLIAHIKRLTVNELQNLQLARSKTDSVNSNSCRLECLRSLCDNLRICFNNLASLCSFVQNNKTLQARLFHYQLVYLQQYQMIYQILSSRLIQMSQEFVSKGLLVLSHSELSRFTHDDLWEISRGIEEYNIIIDHCLLQKRVKLLREFCYVYDRCNFNIINRHIDNQISGIRLMSFSRILYKLAAERSLLIAHNVHNYFFQSSILSIELLKYCFNRENSSQKFDYPTCLGELAKFGSPVNDYLRLEYEFTSNFLDIISQSTEMLKELSLTNLPKRKLHKEDTVENFMAPLITYDNDKCQNKHVKLQTAPSSSSPSTLTTGGTPTSSPFLSVNKPPNKPRKGVQWSDHKDVSLRHQVIGRYLSVVWKMVDSLLSEAKHFNWSCELPLGAWTLLPANCRNIIGKVIVKMATSEFFPVGFIPVLHHQVQLIEYENLLLEWDKAMCTSKILNQTQYQTMDLIEDVINEISLPIITQIQSRLDQPSSHIKQPELRGESIQTPLEQLDPLSTLISILAGSTLPRLREVLSLQFSPMLNTNISASTSTSTSTAVNSNSPTPPSPLNNIELAQIIWPFLSYWNKIELLISNIVDNNIINNNNHNNNSSSSSISNTALDSSHSSVTDYEHEYDKLIVSMATVSIDQPGCDPSMSIRLIHHGLLLIYQSQIRDKVNQLFDIGFTNQERSPPPVTESTVCLGGAPLNILSEVVHNNNNSDTTVGSGLNQLTSPAIYQQYQYSAYAHAVILTVLHPLLSLSPQSISSTHTIDLSSFSNDENEVGHDYTADDDAIRVTLNVICNAWKDRLHLLQNDKILSESQISTDISILRHWLTESIQSGDRLNKLLETPSFVELENYASSHSYFISSSSVSSMSSSSISVSFSSHSTSHHNLPSSMGHFLQRQTSEMGQKVMKGCVWVRQELRSRSSTPHIFAPNITSPSPTTTTTTSTATTTTTSSPFTTTTTTTNNNDSNHNFPWNCNNK